MARMLNGRINYANVVATLALVIALGGSAYATTLINGKSIKKGTVRAKQLAKNSVRSKQIKNGQVRPNDLRRAAVTTPKIKPLAVTTGKLKDASVTTPKLADGAVTEAKLGPNVFNFTQIQKRVTGGCAIGQAIASVNQDGTVACEALSVSGPASGDLTGNYPNPDIAENAVGSLEVSNNTLTGSDIDESTLDVPHGPFNGKVYATTATSNGSGVVNFDISAAHFSSITSVLATAQKAGATVATAPVASVETSSTSQISVRTMESATVSALGGQGLEASPNVTVNLLVLGG